MISRNLPSIPLKSYFTVREVLDLCKIEQHILRYWDSEFIQPKIGNVKINRRYYNRKEVFLIRRIRDLLYNKGFTIHRVKNLLSNVKDCSYYDLNCAVNLTGSELNILNKEIESTISLLKEAIIDSE
ncbi:sequence-specific DNA binding transcription factor [Candidatus Kinetoplastibacterium blastocrithidii TCC012E]|uniref:Sequence-specific DNA binding transcription factor n=1 Tax=Candidatus Kinetoplastidibacterium blastocrithidiae TCC012E TaxID=1208922 RepID=M1M3M1_9PROT|nr:MerR family transcriptional regulator [Candidatus Kinetoplastibacterium blastocrithidii]AFZ83608.1 MerR family transcriptional regulator [Candidatus Kinetoplastibacterium blastocrithidii (ex Strigomonas culicis)]AGF49729.1 sequence-specific DNA binding transcription factor [Candidatus Kinetoplastibacterium blastocrithidii TCC012E]